QHHVVPFRSSSHAWGGFYGRSREPPARAGRHRVRRLGLAPGAVPAHRGAGRGSPRRSAELGAGQPVGTVERRRTPPASRIAARVMFRGGGHPWRKPAAISLGAVLAAGIVSALVRPLTHAAASPLFVAAVTASAWLGGLRWGLLATVLATIALDAV